MRNQLKNRNTPTFSFETIGLVPPQCTEIEAALIGMLMTEPAATSKVKAKLTSEMFYREANQIIYSAILDVFNAGNEPDLIAVNNQLRKNGRIDEAGGIHYLTDCSKKILASGNIEHFANEIIARFIQRELIVMSAIQQRKAYDEGCEVLYELGEAQQKIEGLLKMIAGINAKPQDITKLAVEGVKDYYQRKTTGSSNEYATGIYDLDKHLMIERGDLVILAARPGMGKTAFMIQLAKNYAKRNLKCLIISLEMTAKKLTSRLLICESEIDSYRFRNGCLHNEEENKLQNSINVVSELPIEIDDHPAQSIYEIEAKALLTKPQVLFLDYMGLCKLPELDTRNNELGAVSRGLKGLAKKLNIPVIALHQLSRKPESRGDKRPMLSDLRDSGEIEQDADIVMFLYREKYYNKEAADEIEVIISKYREGATNPLLLYTNYQVSNIYNTQTF